jgi:cell division protease FtsH
VSAERYERARSMGTSEDLFTLSQPGIVLFDDFDLAVRDREQFGATSHHSTFLGELDGLRVREGVVFLFTTNAALSDLDPAFLRPGRIDVVAHFPCPDAELRRRFVLERWQADICEALDFDAVVADTAGLSFAEMEGLRTHLVLQFLVGQQWDWSRAMRSFREDQRRSPHRRVGFVDARTSAVDLPLETIRNSD